MTDSGDRPRERRPLAWALAVIAAHALLLCGCAQPAGYGSTSPPSAYRPDPYHYRCTGACRNAG